MKDIENNLNLVKGPGMTIEELFEKFGTEVGEEELLNVKCFRDILDHYKTPAMEEQYRTEKEQEILHNLKQALGELAKAYSTMSEEELSDVTPFDVLNDVDKLI